MFVYAYVYGEDRVHVDGGWTPLFTHPQGYCEPMSLIFVEENLNEK